MKCARCKRELRTFTALIGGYPFGPTCAARMGLSTTKPKRVRKVRHVATVEQNPNQFELTLDWMP